MRKNKRNNVNKILKKYLNAKEIGAVNDMLTKEELELLMEFYPEFMESKTSDDNKQ